MVCGAKSSRQRTRRTPRAEITWTWVPPRGRITSGHQTASLFFSLFCHTILRTYTCPSSRIRNSCVTFSLSLPLFFLEVLNSCQGKKKTNAAIKLYLSHYLTPKWKSRIQKFFWQFDKHSCIRQFDNNIEFWWLLNKNCRVSNLSVQFFTLWHCDIVYQVNRMRQLVQLHHRMTGEHCIWWVKI